MIDKLHPTPIETLGRWIFSELNDQRSIVGICESLFYHPDPADRFRSAFCGQALATPIGVAAGPHTQMAQNIVAAYLCGARFIELKTVQILDQIEVSKPCIDVYDVGYNCEWSQELSIKQSYQEYLKAWILIHALRSHDSFAHSTQPIDFLFNISVGYDLAGIKRKPVQDFLSNMQNAQSTMQPLLDRLRKSVPSLDFADPDSCISENVTLSTMHGCPPGEIEQIGLHLIEELGLHTAIKLNPTLLGAEKLRHLLNHELGFFDIEVPKQAFEHDPSFDQALDLIRSLGSAAAKKGVHFWVKLTNTLETVNHRKILPHTEPVHYMSGRALQPLVVELAKDLSEAFSGKLPLSYSGGADAFNVSRLLSCGLHPVTVCTDLLRPGGYGRLSEYLEQLQRDMHLLEAADLNSLIFQQALVDPRRRRALTQIMKNRPGVSDWYATGVSGFDLSTAIKEAANPGALEHIVQEACQAGLLADQVAQFSAELVAQAALVNLGHYAQSVASENRYKRKRRTNSHKTRQPLEAFDCIRAPCQEACPTLQHAPGYIQQLQQGNLDRALEVILADNPLAHITSAVCIQACTEKCVRNHYDGPIAIRELKRFITQHAQFPQFATPIKKQTHVGVLGAGPAGLACATYLAAAGLQVSVYDQHAQPGGMAHACIPSFRLDQSIIDADIRQLKGWGVAFNMSQALDLPSSWEQLRATHDYLFLALGAGTGYRLGIEGEQASGVFDCLAFLQAGKEREPLDLGSQVIVVGGGNSAMDAARTARLVGAEKTRVCIVYRRDLPHMPVDDHELALVQQESIEIRTLTNPVRIEQDSTGRICALWCLSMKLGEDDHSGRPTPIPIAGSEFRLPCTSLIVAIGQQTNTVEYSSLGLRIDKHNRPVVDQATLETSLAGVFAGGDAVRGAASIVSAIADGKRAAWEICRRQGVQPVPPYRGTKPVATPSPIPRLSREEIHNHLQHRSRRKAFWANVPTRPFDQETANSQAQHCLACDRFCSLCVTVCPNRANLLYQIQPGRITLPSLIHQGNDLVEKGSRSYVFQQGPQIINLADWCNHCGNCQTFCPALGAPYQDKPRLCHSPSSFAAQRQAYRLDRLAQGYCMQMKTETGSHKLNCIDQNYTYQNDQYTVEFRADPIELCSFFTNCKKPDGTQVDLSQMVMMLVLVKGLLGSHPYLVDPLGEPKTKNPPRGS